MKALILILVSFAAYGQSGDHFKSKPEHTFVDGRKSIRPKGYSTTQFIALQFSPSKVNGVDKTHAEIYRICVSDTSKSYYDNYTKQYNKYHNLSNRRIDIRFVIDGIITDYTFEEFRKILWP